MRDNPSPGVNVLVRAHTQKVLYTCGKTGYLMIGPAWIKTTGLPSSEKPCFQSAACAVIPAV